MAISIHKFLLISLIIMGIGIQAFISCTLEFPEDGATSSNSAENSSSSSAILGNGSSSSKQNGFSSSSLAENQSSSSSVSESSSSSGSMLLSSSNISSSSNDISSSSSSISIPSSSSLALSSSSVCTAKDNTQTQYCSSGVIKEYGIVSYESQEYKTVVIGTQTWMAANLNYNPNTGRSKCYAEHNQQPEPPWLTPEAAKANCNKYGRLYDWATAMNLSANCNKSSCASQVQKPHKGICPNGWHIPSKEDWEALRKFIEDDIFFNWEDIDFGWDVGTKLKALTGWKETSTADKGVDSYGFGAIGSGYCVSCEELSSAAGFYSGEKEEAHWWSATEYVNQYTNDATKAYKNEVTYNKKVITQETEKKADYLYSVRCMKN